MNRFLASSLLPRLLPHLSPSRNPFTSTPLPLIPPTRFVPPKHSAPASTASATAPPTNSTSPTPFKQVLAAGWQTVTYRQNTELHMEAWHWNPNGTWSDPAGKGYFVGNATPGPEPIRHSYGYPLPHRGVTRDDGTDTDGYSRLTDGDPNTYWKSNPYLAEHLHRRIRFAPSAMGHSRSRQAARNFRHSHRLGRALRHQFRRAVFHRRRSASANPLPASGKPSPAAPSPTAKVATASSNSPHAPITAQFIRILMTASSNTCDTHGSADKRNCLGYAIHEIYLGTTSADGKFHDLVRHTPDQDQTMTYCSSVDPWHEPSDLDEHAGEQVGFDLFFMPNGYTRGLPAMIPIAMIYSTPEDAANQLTYLEKRGYPISHVEMGEEPDGHFMIPEDYAAMYIQFAAALHRVDPKLKLGGPIFTGVNKDIETWPDANGQTSWTRRFVNYLQSHGKISELAFFSFEHYPFEPGKIQWSNLYDEPKLVTGIMKIWREDGVPANVPLLITESNLSWVDSEAFPDIFGGLWLADYICSFLNGGGQAVYYFPLHARAHRPRHQRLSRHLRYVLHRPRLQNSAATLAIFLQPTHQSRMGPARQRRTPSLQRREATSAMAPATISSPPMPSTVPTANGPS